MGKRIEVEVPHPHSVEEAIARMAALGDYFHRKYGARVSWPAPERASLVAKYAMVRLQVDLDVRDGHVLVGGEVPRLLLGKARDYAARKVRAYLDPQTPLEALPRG